MRCSFFVLFGFYVGCLFVVAFCCLVFVCLGWFVVCVFPLVVLLNVLVPVWCLLVFDNAVCLIRCYDFGFAVWCLIVLICWILYWFFGCVWIIVFIGCGIILLVGFCLCCLLVTVCAFAVVVLIVVYVCVYGYWLLGLAV